MTEKEESFYMVDDIEFTGEPARMVEEAVTLETRNQAGITTIDIKVKVMATDIIAKIMAQIESDPTINTKEIRLNMTIEGFLMRRKALNVHGSIASIAEKDRVMEIAQREAGVNFVIMDKLVIR